MKGASVLQMIKGAALKIMGALRNELNWKIEKSNPSRETSNAKTLRWRRAWRRDENEGRPVWRHNSSGAELDGAP